MAYACKILADSINDHHDRLTTFEITFPRFILAEVNTHRMLSRNSASSRAIPVKKSIDAVLQDGFVPEEFGLNEPGMVASRLMSETETLDALVVWNHIMDESIGAAQKLADLEVHKALANRVLEPYKWHTAILSGTDWSNFFALRTEPNAQPEFRRIAGMMREAYLAHEPNELSSGEWHLPLVEDEEINQEALQYADPFVDWELWKKISIGRCARVSYLTHDGKRDLQADIALHDFLKSNGHLSPSEHVARPFKSDEWRVIDTITEYLWGKWYIDGDPREAFLNRLARNLEYCGNYRGWFQARFEITNQDDFSKVLGLSV